METTGNSSEQAEASAKGSSTLQQPSTDKLTIFSWVDQSLMFPSTIHYGMIPESSPSSIPHQASAVWADALTRLNEIYLDFKNTHHFEQFDDSLTKQWNQCVGGTVYELEDAYPDLEILHEERAMTAEEITTFHGFRRRYKKERKSQASRIGASSSSGRSSGIPRSGGPDGGARRGGHRGSDKGRKRQ